MPVTQFLGLATAFQLATQSAALTSRLTGGWNMTPCLRWKVKTFASGLTSTLVARSGTVSIVAPSAATWYLYRPSKT